MTNYFKDQPKTDYYLAQKSEMLLFDKSVEAEDKNETFVWRKKDKKIGLDKLDPQKVLMLNKLKQEETARELEKLKRRKIEREREREELDRERVSSASNFLSGHLCLASFVWPLLSGWLDVRLVVMMMMIFLF